MSETIAATPLDPSPDPGTETLPRPRVRGGAILWGVVLIATSATVLWTVSSPIRRAAAIDALLDLDAFGWTVVAVVTVGGIVTLSALAAVIHRIQLRIATRKGGGSADE